MVNLHTIFGDVSELKNLSPDKLQKQVLRKIVLYLGFTALFVS